VQKILIGISLTLIYFIGFGATLFLMMVFNRKALKGNGKNADTFWVNADGYSPDVEDSLRQS
jgi:hypothetical protein